MKSWFVLAIPFAVLLAWGCYKPGLKGAGFYCHPTDSPACPDGQECVPVGSEYRCQDSTGLHLLNDGGTLPRQDGGTVGGGGGGGGGGADLGGGGGGGGGQTGCKGYVACLVACGTDSSCQTSCDNNVSTNGQQLFQAAVGCVQDYCLKTTGECTIDSSGTMLVDSPTANPGDCNACLNAGLGKLTGQSCTGDPDCNPAQCSTDENACLADTP